MHREGEKRRRKGGKNVENIMKMMRISAEKGGRRENKDKCTKNQEKLWKKNRINTTCVFNFRDIVSKCGLMDHLLNRG